MKIIAIICTVMTLLFTGCTTSGNLLSFKAGDREAAVSHLEEYIEEQMKESGTVGLSVVIVDESGMFWSAGFGFADKEKGVPAGPETLFDLASVSKLFTATAIMQMAEDGKLDLDAPVSAYLPEFDTGSQAPDVKSITVRNLLTHHSGIQPDWLKDMLYRSPVQEPDMRFTKTVELLEKTESCWPPEYVWAYSNLGYSILGTIIDRLSDDSFYGYMRKNVLDAADMKTSAYIQSADKTELISAGYANGEKVPFLVEREVPAGGLASSATELGGFISAYLDPEDQRLLPQSARDQMFTRQNSTIRRDLDFAQGLCWMISNHGFTDAGRVVFHDGGEWSANTTLSLLPDLGVGFAILTNSAEGSEITLPISREIIRVMYRLQKGRLPAEYIRPEDVKRPANKPLEGYYIYQSLGIVEVFEKKDELWAVSGGMKMKLIPNAMNRYRLKPMLLGILPIKIPFLEPMEISFEEVDGDLLSGVYRNGEALPEIGIRIEKPELNQLWNERQGTYELVNADEGEFPIIAPWEFSIENGFPTISGKLYGSFPFSMVIMPVDDELTKWAGIGRRAGDIIRFEEKPGETLIHYQGFIYSRKKTIE